MKIKKKKERPQPSRPQPAAEAAESPEAVSGRRGRSQFKQVASVIKPDMIPYLFWKEWVRALERNDYLFIWDMTADGSELRKQFGPRDEFAETCRRKLRPLPGMRDADLRRIRLNGADEAHVIQAYGVRERERQDFTVERWFMLRGETGWRVHRIDEGIFPKSRDVADVGVDDFPTPELPAWFPPMRDAREAERVARRKAAREAAAAEAATTEA